MKNKLLQASKLISEAIELLAEAEGLPAKRRMTLQEFRDFLGDRNKAVALAKQCKIGHSVFVNILDGYLDDKGKVRVMRQGTKDRILTGLNIEIIEEVE